MFRKLNLKTIIILFAGLLALVVIVNVVDSRKNERTFKDDLVEVIADDVTQVKLYPKVLNGKEIVLEKEDSKWVIIEDGTKIPADGSTVSSMISELNRMKPESVVSTKKDKWKQYEVNDSLASRVILNSGDKVLADVYIGKMAFSQQRKATSYVRLKDDNVIYGVDGYLSMSFNRDQNSFRNKQLLKVEKADITRISVNSPEGTFKLEKQNEKWMINNVLADSTEVTNYISSIYNLKHYTFAEAKPEGEAIYKLTVEGNNMAKPIRLDAYAAEDDELIVTSSQNVGNYFKGKDLREKIFPSRDKF